MRNVIIALAVLLLLGSTAYGGWYVGPRAVYTYYPPAGPVYAYGAPVVAPPYVTYSPVAPVPLVAPGPVWVAPPAVIVAPRVYYPGQPVRNVLRAVVP